MRRLLLPVLLAILASAPVPAAASTAAPAAPAMTTYRFGLLRKGPTWTADRTPRTDSLQAGHMANIRRMHAMGKLIAAGPFEDGGDLRGIFVFRADSLAEVRALAAADPAIASDRLRLDVWDWTAPEGVGARYEAMSRRPGFRDSMITVTFGVLKKGPKYSGQPGAGLDALLRAHGEHVLGALASGELLSAGPLVDADPWAGILFFPGGKEQAQRIAERDPAVRSGHFAVELYTLWVADGAIR